MAVADSRQQLVIDCGRLGWRNAGHGHADALSVSLIRNQRNLLIDPGTFEYVGNSGERARLRGTGAHNTMLVDGQDQAESTGPFSWKNVLRVKVESWIVGRGFDFFEGSHDGYCRLPSPVTHRRWVFHRKGNFWFVLDRADGSGRHQLDIAWHIGATLNPVSLQQHVFVDGQDSLTLLTAEGNQWLRRDDWSPAYGRRESASVLNFGAHVELPADFATLLIAGAGVQEDPGGLVRLNTEGNTSSWRYRKGAQEHNFVFCHEPGPWTCRPWTSDADFLYWSFDAKEEKYNLILCNGSYAHAGSHPVLSCDGKMRYAELSGSAAKVDLFSSHPESVVLQPPIDSVWGLRDAMVQGDTKE